MSDSFGQLLEVIQGLRLKCVEQVTVNGARDGVSVILNDPSEAIELLRRCHSRGIDVVYYPHPETDDQAVVYIRD